jgi:hypothetical protein
LPLDDEFLVAVGIFHHAVLRRSDRALGNLVVEFPQLLQLQLMAILAGIPLGLGDQYRALERREHIRLGEFIEHVQLRLGRVEVFLRLLDGEVVGFELQLVT